MFAYLKEHEASKVDNPRPVDLSPECCSMLEKLMLAQAQVSKGEWRVVVLLNILLIVGHGATAL